MDYMILAEQSYEKTNCNFAHLKRQEMTQMDCCSDKAGLKMDLHLPDKLRYLYLDGKVCLQEVLHTYSLQWLLDYSEHFYQPMNHIDEN